jgi:hypothetical protein
VLWSAVFTFGIVIFTSWRRDILLLMVIPPACYRRRVSVHVILPRARANEVSNVSCA